MRLKKRFFAVVYVGATLACFAQQIDISKTNEVFIDGKKVATLFDVSRNEFKVIDLNGKNTLNLKKQTYSDPVSKKYTIWYEMRASFSQSVADILLDRGSFSFNTKKLCVESLFKEKLIHSEGINVENVATYFNNHNEKKSDQLTGETLKKLEAISQQQQRNEWAKSINPFVSREGNILKGGHEGTEIIGFVDAPKDGILTTIKPVKIYDNNKNLIAIGKISLTKPGLNYKTFDGQERAYSSKFEYNELLMPLYLGEICQFLIAEGYLYQETKIYSLERDTFLEKEKKK